MMELNVGSLKIAVSLNMQFVLKSLFGFLEGSGLEYRISGGLAGNLHGSEWPLHDIDLDVPARHIPQLRNYLIPYVFRELDWYEDEEFGIMLLQARILGVDIDVSRVEGARLRNGERWILHEPDFSRRCRRELLGIAVWVTSLEDLIAYKEIIGRKTDLEELTRLGP